VLGGLVGITAGCANLDPVFALVTGAAAGVIVIYSTAFLERFVDDAVGAVTVHGVCGAWGTLAAGLFDSAGMFNPATVGVQILGVLAAFLWAFPLSYLVFKAIHATVGLRVNGDLEALGLDLHEHDNQAYPEFVASDELSLAEV
ncbi:MAG: ammonium transporter, partial [Bacteroidota bacterium]